MRGKLAFLSAVSLVLGAMLCLPGGTLWTSQSTAANGAAVAPATAGHDFR